MGTKERASQALDALIATSPHQLEIEAIKPMGFEVSSAVRCLMICNSCVGVHASFSFTIDPLSSKSMEQQAQEGYQRHVDAKHG